ncbi:YjfB family protein [Cytobacillus firmus]|uniref:YjfB family protein n=1 Tax=Cytobacillus firmus TaxID=1399 RepID=UPI00218485F3|nr:YjfB family protein [Cytobacillus firmus]URM33482.1 YjfB family protein [Cytobacillus firmus]
MDIALLSMVLKQGQFQQQASISILKTAMEQAEVNAESITSMLSGGEVQALQQAAQPHLGGHIDLKG